MKKLYILILLIAPTFIYGQIWDFTNNTTNNWTEKNSTITASAEGLHMEWAADKEPKIEFTTANLDASLYTVLAVTVINKSSEARIIRCTHPDGADGVGNKGTNFPSQMVTDAASSQMLYFTLPTQWQNFDFDNDLGTAENMPSIAISIRPSSGSKMTTNGVSSSNTDIIFEKIELLASLPLAEKNAFEFTNGTIHDGFDDQTRCTLTDELDYVKLLNDGSTTQFYSFAPSLFYVNATANKQFAIRLKNNTITNDIFRLSYTDEDGTSNPGFVEGLITTGDTGYTTYIVDLAADPAWGGNKLIKFTVKSSTETYDLVNTVDIDYIRFTNVAEVGTVLATVLSVNEVDLKDDASIQLYPNPVQNTLRVNASNAINKIEVYNILGQRVLESENTNKMNVQNLNKGVYISKIFMDNDRISTKRFIKD